MKPNRFRSFSLVAAGVAAGVAATVLFANAWRADAAVGDTDTTFVPVAPCRLIDTRPGDDRVGPFDAFGPTTTRTVPARGAVGQCVIPTDAVGLSLNVTAIGASSGTFLTFWPSGPRPLASSLNPSPGEPPTPNAVVTPLSTTGSFEAFNFAGTTEVIIDVNGYYTKSSLQEIATRLTALETAGGATGAAGGDLTGSYPSPDIAANAVTGAEVADNTLTGADVNESGLAIAGDVTGTLASAQIAANAVTGAEVADTNSLTSAEIDESGLAIAGDVTGTLGAAQLAGDSVGTAEIADGAVGSADVADNALRLENLAFGIAEESTLDHAGVVVAGACTTPVDDVIDLGVAPVGSLTFVVAVGLASGGFNPGWTVDGETTTTLGSGRVRVCNTTGADADPPNLVFGYITIAP